MDLHKEKITVHDMCLRDGMHAKRHQITINEMVKVSKAMDEAGIPMIEVTHGDGLGGASVNYGFPAAKDGEYLTAVCKEMKNAKEDNKDNKDNHDNKTEKYSWKDLIKDSEK